MLFTSSSPYKDVGWTPRSKPWHDGVLFAGFQGAGVDAKHEIIYVKSQNAGW